MRELLNSPDNNILVISLKIKINNNIDNISKTISVPVLAISWLKVWMKCLVLWNLLHFPKSKQLNCTILLS